MRRRPLLAMGAIFVAGILALAAAAVASDRRQAFTLGVPMGIPVKLHPRGSACQAPITVPTHADFDGVTISLGTNKRPGPTLNVAVADVRGQPDVSRGRLPAGYPDVDHVPSHTVWLDHRVQPGRTVAVCIHNVGSKPVFVFGNAAAASRSSAATIDGKPQSVDLSMSFARRRPASLASLLPAMIYRATLFRAEWVHAWMYVVLGVMVLLVVPVLLLRSLTRAIDGGPPGRGA